METQTPFRIGGVYWNRNRDTPVLLEDCGVSGQALMVLEGGSGMALWVRARVSDGFAISPETGFDWGGEDGLSLLPGELERREGQWVPRGVPVEDKPAIYERERVSEHKAIVKRVPRPVATPPSPPRSAPAPHWIGPTPSALIASLTSSWSASTLTTACLPLPTTRTPCSASLKRATSSTARLFFARAPESCLPAAHPRASPTRRCVACPLAWCRRAFLLSRRRCVCMPAVSFVRLNLYVRACP
jgi:hypothetical protein